MVVAFSSCGVEVLDPDAIDVEACGISSDSHSELGSESLNLYWCTTSASPLWYQQELWLY